MLGNRIKETTTTTGTGSLTLAGAATNFATFNGRFSNDTTDEGKSFYYWIVDDTNNVWECGIGHLTASTTLARDTIVDNSSGTTSALSLSAGTKDVFNAPINTSLSAGSVGYNANSGNTASKDRLSIISNQSLTANTIYYIPYQHNSTKRVTSMVIDVAVGNGTAVSNLAIYENIDGIPVNKIAEVNGTADCSTAGTKTVSFSTAVMLPQGEYFFAVITDDSLVDLEGSTATQVDTNCLGVDATGNKYTYVTESGSGTTLPGTAGTLSYSTGAVLAIGIT